MFKITTSNFTPIHVFTIILDADEVISEIKENNLPYDNIFKFIKDRFIEEYNPIYFKISKIDSYYNGHNDEFYDIFRINTRSIDNKHNYYDLYLKIPDRRKFLSMGDFTRLSLSSDF